MLKCNLKILTYLPPTLSSPLLLQATAKPQGLFFPTDDGKDSGINFAIPPDLNKNETIGFDAGTFLHPLSKLKT